MLYSAHGFSQYSENVVLLSAHYQPSARHTLVSVRSTDLNLSRKFSRPIRILLFAFAQKTGVLRNENRSCPVCRATNRETITFCSLPTTTTAVQRFYLLYSACSDIPYLIICPTSYL